ncbi:spore germination protein [Paenibacillus pinistramenti]|uniref:spore germination protein n=1 Tax=Paenibacillus pinistramenti TaxID=1768003 RepID=UPI0011086501|nr:spore germination protein [Paenibacillus pinistramenti]
MADSKQQASKGNTISCVKEQLAKMSDLEHQTLGFHGQKVQFIYLTSLCDSKIVNRSLIAPLYEMGDDKEYELYIASFPGCQQLEAPPQIVAKLLQGCAALAFDSGNLYLFDAARVEASGVAPAESETIVQGPSDSFNESLDVSLNLIRRRYQSASLKSEARTIGAQSKTKLAVIYDEDRVDHNVLKELMARLDNINIDILQGAAELDRYLASTKFRLFPTTILTERPDRAVFNLSEGKVIILVDTTGYAVIVPVIFNDFFTAMDDKLQVTLVGWFLKGIRYLGLVLTTVLPAIYVAFSSYNSEVWKIQIALLVAGSRATVPYPSFVEVILMLLMMEFLTEASLRLPKAIGSTATTVGGLILGTAATEAGLVSNIMIILVSVVAISNFVIPLNMMGFTVRVIKYALIVVATLYGLLGIICGCLVLVMYLTSLRSFGKPYFRIFVLDRLKLGRTSMGEKNNG